MRNNYTPSINLLRDQNNDINYIVTPNANKIALQINDLFVKGFRSFNIIGSYGTGKSSFLWAFEKSLKSKSSYFNITLGSKEQVEIVNIIGEFNSFKNLLSDSFGLSPENSSYNDILNYLREKIQQDTLFLLVVDEFGKILEYAVEHNINEEVYFIQQLAELFNDPNNKGIFITTLHQSFDAYAGYNLSDSDRNEWKKVKGRFKDLTFNEPIEQLLLLAAENIGMGADSPTPFTQKIFDLQQKNHLIKIDGDYIKEISPRLLPLDLFSAYVLCVALQRYGQNERSLFTFMEAEMNSIQQYSSDGKVVGIVEVFDYIYHEFYSYINSKYNVDYSNWALIVAAIERIDASLEENRTIAEDIIKVVGMFTLFGHKGAHIDDDFLTKYLDYVHSAKNVKSALSELDKNKILRFNRFSHSYKIFEGTDINIEDELLKISPEVGDKLDLTSKLMEHFEFPVINAKSISYKKGTPRFFQYTVSETPITNYQRKDYQIDGIINLIIDSADSVYDFKDLSSEEDDVLYANFLNSKEIRNTVYDIEKTNQLLVKVGEDDRVAKRELINIYNSQKTILNHLVLDTLFTKNVHWFYKGSKVEIDSNKALNRKLSEICEDIFPHCPSFRNELINRQHLSGSIGSAKKNLFKNLVNNYHEEDLGFSKTTYPAEKTIYLALLNTTGIHRINVESDLYSLNAPMDSEFHELWRQCLEFLEHAKKEPKKVAELYDLLKEKPFKLTVGFLEFWIPLFLFVNRDEFALFGKEDGYLPELNETILYLFTRTPENYTIKAFDIAGVKLDLFNKYREFLQLKQVGSVNNNSLIESIKPFLVFHRDLNSYIKNTKRLSRETIKIRNTIENTQDPEKLFFEEFPKALGTDLNEILASENQLADYVGKLRRSIKELRTCFEELINRLENYLVEEVLNEKNLSFTEYKKIIEDRYGELKEHMLLPHQKSLLIRLNSPLDDRKSWLNSICQVLLMKSLDAINDKEEDLMKQKLSTAFNELDNLLSISDKQEENLSNEVIKLQFTSFAKGTMEETIVIPKEVSVDLDKKLKELKGSLGINKKMNLYLLMTLLKKELNE